MILRLVALLVSGGLAYAMLQGWPAAVPGLVRTCLAVLVLLAGLSWWAVGATSEKLPLARGRRKPGWLDYGAIGLGLLALECGFLWVFNVSKQPLESVAIMVEKRFRPESAERRSEEMSAVSVGGNWLWQSEQRRPLPMRTNLKPGAKPEVFIRLSKKEDAESLLEDQIYVRAFTLDRYRDGVWSSTTNGGAEIEAGEDGWIRFEDESKGGILHEVFHGDDERGRDVLITLQGATAVRLPWLRKSGEGTYILPEASDTDGYEYLANSSPLKLADLKGDEAEPSRIEGWVSNPRIRELALRAAGTGTVLEKLANIEKFLRDRYGYSLVTRNPRGIDPLENFLFVERRGHCEFFATAAALMIRELGFDSRIAYGWAGGQYFEVNNSFVFRAREAHSWVEVKVDGYGWVLIEPTPPIVLGENGRPSRAGSDAEFPDDGELLEDTDDEHVAETENMSVVSLSLAGFFALGAIVVILMREKTKPDAGGRQVFGGKRSRGYLVTWKNVALKRGFWRRGRTIKMQISDSKVRPEFADDLTAYHYGITYEGSSPESELEDQLERRIRDWKPGG